MRLSVAYITGRLSPQLPWLVDSLAAQVRPGDQIDLILVDAHRRTLGELGVASRAPWASRVTEAHPIPNIWQGRYRVTPREMWAGSVARNTAFVWCRTEWIACVDDRCVLVPGWLDRARAAVAKGPGTVTAGAYEKRVGMRVAGGEIVEHGKATGADHRKLEAPQGRGKCSGGWLYGCCFVVALETALKVNGFEHGMCGLGMEDVIFGLNLEKAGFRIDYDADLMIVEDRTPGQIDSGADYLERRQERTGVRLIDRPFVRFDKGISPRDKSHAALERFGKRARTEFTPDLRELRAGLAAGRPLPIPDLSADYRDWFDGQPLHEMVPPP